MAAPAHIARENGKKGGRPKGALAKMSIAKARELGTKNETPLDVMVDNMLFWRKRANELTQLMEEKLQQLMIADVKDASVIGPALQDFNKAAAHMIAAREQSQKCAVEAAPYVHPKLTSIAVKDKGSRAVKIQMALAVTVAQTLMEDAPQKIKSNGGTALVPAA